MPLQTLNQIKKCYVLPICTLRYAYAKLEKKLHESFEVLLQMGAVGAHKMMP